MSATVQAYSKRVLEHSKIHAPVTLRTVCALVCWRVAECNAAAAPSGALANLLNTTHPLPGSKPYNSVGVQNYTGVAQGVWATVLTLTNGRYGAILDALRNDKPAPDVLAALVASPWGTSIGDNSRDAIDQYCLAVYNRWGVEAFANVRGT